MEKNTILQLAAIGATVISVVAKILVPPPTSIFGFASESTPIIKMPDSAEVAAEKTAAVKELVNSEAFTKALPSAQKQMLQTIKDLYN